MLADRPSTRASKAEQLAWLDEFVAEHHGGRCVSETYVSYAVPLDFVCRAGHRFSRRPRQITQSLSWCPECEGAAKLSSLDADVQGRHGGRCLSKVYTKQSDKHWFSCSLGHVFSATPNNVLHHDSWCPECAGNAVLELESYELLAELHGGELLTRPARLRRDSRLMFRCARDHRFTLHLQHYYERQHSWCMECARLERREDFQARIVARAEDLEYVLLSGDYVSSRVPLELRCPDGHRWHARSYDFLGGKLCPECRALGGEATLRRRHHRTVPR